MQHMLAVNGPTPPARIASVTTVVQSRDPAYGIVNSDYWDRSTDRALAGGDGFTQGQVTKFRGNALVIPTGRVR
jgi:hypothetical protein